YPDAQAVEWKDKLTAFVASFIEDDINYAATFSNDGEWQVTEHNINENQLPAAVKDGYDKSKFSDWKLLKVVYLEYPENEINYRVEVGKGDIKKRNLYFNSDGRLIKDKMTL
ncbi:MAG: PepSY-like domain-containing protein, partial [Chitinophagaceae bacterium]|nr:PepSY-like domain-containing protein [Chitinophagaceae bacterium]